MPPSRAMLALLAYGGCLWVPHRMAIASTLHRAILTGVEYRFKVGTEGKKEVGSPPLHGVVARIDRKQPWSLEP